MVFSKKYRRIDLVVGVTEVTTPGNYGMLGSLTCGDFIVTTAAGSLATLSGAALTCGFIEAPDNTALTGTL